MLECYFKNYEHFLSNGGIFIKSEDGFLPFQMVKTGVKRGELIVKPEGFTAKEQAMGLLKKEVFVERSSLDELETEKEGHFVADLIGLKIFMNEETEVYGFVLDVVDFGGGPLLEVEISHTHPNNNNKKEKLEYYEKSENIVKEVNLLEGYIKLFN